MSNNEKALISALLQKPEYLPHIKYSIKSSAYFQNTAYRLIYTLMLEMETNGSLVWDDHIIADQLDKKGKLDIVENRTGLFDILHFYNDVTLETFKKVGEAVAEEYISFKTIEICRNLEKSIKQSGNNISVQPIADLLNNTIENLNNIRSTLHSENNTSNVKEITKLVFHEIELIEKEQIGNAFTTGFATLDDYLGGGIQKEDVMIIGARPSIGKTSLAIAIAYNSAVNNKNVLYFSLETSKKSLIRDRLIPSLSLIESKLLRQAKLDGDDWDRLTEIIQKLCLENFRINAASSITVEKILIIIKKEIEEHNTEIIFIDYIQLLTSEKRFYKRHEELQYIADQLRGITKKNNIPMILTAQLNRESEKERRDPVKSDIKECGALEESADIVILLQSDKKHPEQLQLIIDKNRNGIQGDTFLHFNKKFTKLTDPEEDIYL